jgi:hypothetical protein
MFCSIMLLIVFGPSSDHKRHHDEAQACQCDRRDAKRFPIDLLSVASGRLRRRAQSPAAAPQSIALPALCHLSTHPAG